MAYAQIDIDNRQDQEIEELRDEYRCGPMLPLDFKVIDSEYCRDLDYKESITSTSCSHLYFKLREECKEPLTQDDCWSDTGGEPAPFGSKEWDKILEDYKKCVKTLTQ